MFTRFLTWLKPNLIQETEETVLLKRALEADAIEIDEEDIILFDRGLAGIGPYGQLQEARVFDYNDEAAQITYINKNTRKTRWIPIYAITSNLGNHYDTNELETQGYTDPKPQRAPGTVKPLVTGTYIEQIDDDFSLVEIEKINGLYYIHDVDDSYCDQIKQDHDLILHEFSAPEDGHYVLDPGLYINTSTTLHEIIPFQGKCWIRQIGCATIQELENHRALEYTRVESDDEPAPSFYIIDNPSEPQDTDEGPTEGYDPSLEPYKVPELIIENNTLKVQPCTIGQEKCCDNPSECNPTDPI